MNRESNQRGLRFSSSHIRLKWCRREVGQGLGFHLSWVKTDNCDRKATLSERELINATFTLCVSCIGMPLRSWNFMNFNCSSWVVNVC